MVYIESEGGMSGKTKVLVIDDDEGVVKFIQALLDENGYQVEMATQAHEGLAAVRRWQPDLVILDVYMPNLDGLDLLAYLKGGPSSKPLRIIMLTSADTIKSTETAFHLGADAYLTKPIKPTRLLAKIKELMAGKADAS